MSFAKIPIVRIDVISGYRRSKLVDHVGIGLGGVECEMSRAFTRMRHNIARMVEPSGICVDLVLDDSIRAEITHVGGVICRI